MTDSSSKTGSSARLVSASLPQDDDGVDPAVTRWQAGRRRVAALLRPSVESNVVALLSSGLATAVAVLLAVNVYRLHDRVRVLELHCVAGPNQWTEDTSGNVLDKVHQSLFVCCNK